MTTLAVRKGWFWRGLLAAVVGLAVAAGGASPARAASGGPYPVPYTFLANIVAAPFGPDASPPGANDWSCKPTESHPYPVVLVHGLMANQTDNWQTYGPLLANHGYCVFALTYGNDPSAAPPVDKLGGLTAMEDSAVVLGTFIDKVLAATGAEKVDLVGHSEGATMPYWYLKFDGGATKVASMVGLASVVHGTGGSQDVMLRQTPGGQADGVPADAASACASCAEFSPSSSFIQRLDDGGITVPGVRYTQIVTKYDEVVMPYTSGIIDEPGVTNIVVQDQCALDLSDHLAIASDPVVAQDVLNALDPGDREPVPCVPVAPFIG